MNLTAAADPRTRADCLPQGYYDPATAQFLSVDPLFAITGSAYGYTANDPINNSDPLGLYCGSELNHWISGGAYNSKCGTPSGYRANCDVTECPPPIQGSRLPLSWSRAKSINTPSGYCDGPRSGFDVFALQQWASTHSLAASQYDEINQRYSNWSASGRAYGSDGSVNGEQVVRGTANLAKGLKLGADALNACKQGAFYGGSVAVFVGPEGLPVGSAGGCAVMGLGVALYGIATW